MSTGITTNYSKIHNGIRFKNQTLWMAIGRTTPWTNESSPPAETSTTTSIDEIKGFVKITNKSMVYEVSSGEDIVVLGNKYKFSSDNDAYSNNAKFVYLKGEILNSYFIETPFFKYRQIGIYSNLVPVTGHEGDLYLDPSNVSDAGILEYYSNEQPIERRNDRKDVFEFILEFF